MREIDMQRLNRAAAARLPALLTVAEVARWLQVSRRQVIALADAGRLPFVLLGRCRRFRSDLVLSSLVPAVTAPPPSSPGAAGASTNSGD